MCDSYFCFLLLGGNTSEQFTRHAVPTQSEAKMSQWSEWMQMLTPDLALVLRDPLLASL